MVIGAQGFIYEDKINRILKAAGLEKPSFQGAKTDSNAPDGMLLYQGKEYKLEIKLDPTADFGQGGLGYDPKTKKWVVAGNNPDMQNFLNAMGATKIVNQRWTKSPRKGVVPNEKLTKKDVAYDYANFKDIRVLVNASAINNYYNSKNTFYIQIGKAHGLYYMGKDIAGLGCPEFKPEVWLRMRLKRGGSMPLHNYRFSTALQVKRINGKSTMNLEDPRDIQAMAARSQST